jgi:2-polyprenyl-6-methoxyphenol hydroxylase-like FAD-dependent oxidoreductase
MRALVIGGGIGGVTAGCALTRAGVEAAVFEQADDPRRIYVGSGIHLWNNATRALKELGLDRRIIELAGPDAVVKHFRIYSHRGKLLSDYSLEPTAQKIGADCIGINRAELLPALAEQLKPGVLRLGAKCVGFEQDAKGVTARFADGKEERGDVLIAADGAHSPIRTQLYGPSELKYAGYTIWQGITEFPSDLAPIGVFPIVYGPGQRFAYYRVDKRRLYWFAVANAPEGGTEPASERKPMLLERFRGWRDPIAAVIQGTDEKSTHRRDLYDRDPDGRWGEGRVTLLGDAAHAMTFDIGQGAGQSIEDAVVLGRRLGASADPVAGLREYEQRRRGRAAHMQKLSRSVGRAGMWTNPLAVGFRNVFTQVLFRNQFLRRKFDEDLLYDF